MEEDRVHNKNLISTLRELIVYFSSHYYVLFATAVEGIYYCTNLKKGDKTDCNNYRGISLSSTAYKILSNIIRARLTPYVNEVIGDHQCGFHYNRSTTDHIFYIRQILEKKWEYNGTVHQLFIDFKKAYDSIKREILYNILLEFGIPKKLVRPNKVCLN
jgi:hypothetical protein